MSDRVRVEVVDVDRILSLRHAVLRQGLPFEAAKFDHDHAEGSAHFAALANDDEKRAGDAAAIGCCTLVRQPYEGARAWQLRGMAVAPEARKLGVGRKLLDAAELHIRATPYANVWWCNARLVAVPFYERLGWQIVSPLFDIPTAGPHHKMMRQVE